jgi:hypothetical protein
MTGSRVVIGIGGALVLLLAVPPPAATAQDDRRRVNSQRGAELSLFGGASVSATGAGPSFGWSLGWRPTNRIAIEGSASWVGEPHTDGFAAVFGPRFYLRATGRTTAFVTTEVGLFHASVSPLDPEAPRFYLDRMPATVPVEEVFNDFVAALGGGLDLRLTGHLWMRPHVRVLMVVDGWRMRTLAVPGVHLTYKFGEPVGTP